jgi:hypothetical protein
VLRPEPCGAADHPRLPRKPVRHRTHGQRAVEREREHDAALVRNYVRARLERHNGALAPPQPPESLQENAFTESDGALAPPHGGGPGLDLGQPVAGSIASAVYVLAKSLAKGEMPGGSGRTGQNLLVAIGNFQAGKGIGRDLILAQLEGVPGISKNVVRDQLANLKASGDYDRVVGAAVAEAVAELEAVAAAEKRKAEKEAAEKAAQEARDRAKKTKESAQKREDVDFDFQGVSKHFAKPDHTSPCSGSW